ncbi:MAG: hypothetical protein ACM3MM_00375 [Acidobacteriota bacterium]
MQPKTFGHIVIAGVLMAALVACADDATDEAATPLELAEVLLTADDLGEGWAESFIDGSCASPEDCEYDGVVTAEMRADLQESQWPLGGLLEECAATRLTLAELPLMAGAPQALRAMEKEFVAEQNPATIDEALLAGDEAQLIEEFGALTSMIRECLAEPAPPEEQVEARELALPTLGDERFGFVLQIGSGDRWDIRAVMVRVGSTLIVLSENEFPSGESWLSDDEFVAIAQQAVDKLD